MATRIQMRRDVASAWNSINPVVGDGEFALETDTVPYKIKVGDGVTKWKDLPYINTGSSYTNLQDLKFNKSFGVDAENKTGTAILAGRFVFLASSADGGFNIMPVTKTTQYKGELIGYARSGIEPNQKGYVELITTVQTGETSVLVGESAYVGFLNAFPSDNNILIGTRASLEIPFGICGVFGEKNNIGEFTASFNAFELQSNYIMAHYDETRIDYHTNLPTIFNTQASTSYLVYKGTGMGDTVFQTLPPTSGVKLGYEVHVINNSASEQEKITLRVDGSDKISETENSLDILGGETMVLMASDKNWNVLYSARGAGESAQVAKNTEAINRLKSVISADAQDVYTYRGNEMPVIPDKPYKAYYLSFFALKNDHQQLTLPSSSGIADGTIVSIDNNDYNDPLYILPPDGQTIDGKTGTYKIPKSNMVFLIKNTTNWSLAFSGYIPTSLSRLITDIKANLPAGGTSLSLAEIEAQLKDRLHTFREIQTEFDDQLHTYQDLQNYGFENVSIYYGMRDSNTPLPTEADNWISGRIVVDRTLAIPSSSNGMKYLAFVAPLSLAPLIRGARINDADMITFTSSDYSYKGLKYKLLMSSATIDTTRDNNIDFILGQGTEQHNNKKDESFKYLSGSDAVAIPTDKDNVIIDYVPADEVNQTLPSVLNFDVSGTRILVRNMNDNHSVILKASSYQSIEGLSQYTVEPRQNLTLIVDKTNRKYRTIRESNDDIRIDSPSWVIYGWSNVATQPTDDTWIIGEFPATKSATTPASELGDLYLLAMVPDEMAGLVKGFDVNGKTVDVVKSNYDYKGHTFKLLTASETTSMHNSNTFGISWGIEQPAIPSTGGIEIDDGFTNISDVRKINTDGSIEVSTDPSKPNEATLKAFTNFEERIVSDEGGGTTFGGKFETIRLEEPLLAYPDPDATGTGIMYIKHGSYEGYHNEGIFAKLGTETAMSSDSRNDKLYFDETRVSGGGYVYRDMATKSIILQETDELDPNITGGTPFILGFYFEPVNTVASADGHVEIKIVDAITGDYLIDVNGDPIVVRRTYSKGDELAPEFLIAEYKAKGQVKASYEVDADFPGQVIVASSNSCILAQSTSKDEIDGQAYLSFKAFTGYRIQDDHVYYGDGNMNLAIQFQKSMSERTINGHTEYMGDGTFLDTRTNMKASIEGGVLSLKDDGATLPVFSLGKIYTATDTMNLKGKEIAVQVDLIDKKNAFDVALMKWTGNPDEAIPHIVTGYNNMNPVFSTNWVQVDKLFISEDAVDGLHTVSKTFTVPDSSTVKQFAVVLYPSDSQSPMELKLQNMRVDIVDPFTKIIFKDNSHISEEHFKYVDRYYEFWNYTPKGYAGFRYTVDSSDTKLPWGGIHLDRDGEGMVVNNRAWNDTPDKWQTEGDGLFKADGAVMMHWEAQAYVGESVPKGGSSVNEIWVSKVNADGTFTEVKGSRKQFTLKKEVTAPTKIVGDKFRFTTKAGESYRVFGKSDRDDGMYLQSSTNMIPLLKIVIDDYSEVTPEEEMQNDIVELSENTYVKTQYNKPTDVKLQITPDLTNQFILPFGDVVMSNADVELVTIDGMHRGIKMKTDATLNGKVTFIVRSEGAKNTITYSISKYITTNTYQEIMSNTTQEIPVGEQYRYSININGITLSKDDIIVLRMRTNLGSNMDLEQGHTSKFCTQWKLLMNEININEKQAIDKILAIDEEIIITKEAKEAGYFIELDYDPLTKKPSLTAKQRSVI